MSGRPTRTGVIRPDEITFCGRWSDAEKAAMRAWLESYLAERKGPEMPASTLALRAAEPAELPAPAPRFSLADMQVMAKSLADSGLFPDVKTPQQALALMLLCDAENLHPVTAMRRFHIVKGRPAMKADAMLAEFQRQGGVVTWHRYDDRACDATFAHPIHQPEGVRVVWTIERATAAQLTGNSMWQKYPDAMLRARTASEGVRMVLPGISIGIYTPEEVADFAEPRRASARGVAPPPVPETEPPSESKGPRLYSQWVKDAAEKLGITEYQLNNHLHKWACSTEIDGECLVPDRWPNATNADKFAAMDVVFGRHREAVRDEVRRYRKSEAVRLANARAARREAKAGAPGPDGAPDVATRTGKALLAWCQEQEQRHEVGLLKYIYNWAKLQDFPARMIDWDAEQVALAHAEAVRKLQAIQPPVAAPEVPERLPGKGDAYEGPDDGDDETVVN